MAPGEEVGPGEVTLRTLLRMVAAAICMTVTAGAAAAIDVKAAVLRVDYPDLLVEAALVTPNADEAAVLLERQAEELEGAVDVAHAQHHVEIAAAESSPKALRPSARARSNAASSSSAPYRSPM